MGQNFTTLNISPVNSHTLPPPFRQGVGVNNIKKEKIMHINKQNETGQITKKRNSFIPQDKASVIIENQTNIIKRICAKENFEKAYTIVYTNKSMPGIDGMTVYQLKDWLLKNREELIQQLTNYTYKPQPLLDILIIKPNGDTQKLQIPAIIDQFVQQAIAQILMPIFDPYFSSSMGGFNPSMHICPSFDNSYQEKYLWALLMRSSSVVYQSID